MLEILTAAALGVSAGITFGLTSFAKKKDQPFDFTKLGTTIIIGAIAGGLMGATGWQMEIAHTYVLNLGIVPVVENILKTIKRKIFG